MNNNNNSVSDSETKELKYRIKGWLLGGDVDLRVEKASQCYGLMRQLGSWLDEAPGKDLSLCRECKYFNKEGFYCKGVTGE